MCKLITLTRELLWNPKTSKFGEEEEKLETNINEEKSCVRTTENGQNRLDNVA